MRWAFWRKRDQDKDIDMSVLGLPGMLKDSDSNAPYFDNQHSSSSLMTIGSNSSREGRRRLRCCDSIGAFLANIRWEYVIRTCLIIIATTIVAALVVVLIAMEDDNNNNNNNDGPAEPTPAAAQAAEPPHHSHHHNSPSRVPTTTTTTNDDDNVFNNVENETHQIFHEMAPRSFDNLFVTSSSSTTTTSNNEPKKKKPLALIHIGPPLSADVGLQLKLYKYRSELQEIGWDLILPLESKLKSGNCLYAEIVGHDDVPSHICHQQEEEEEDTTTTAQQQSSSSYLATWKELIKTKYSDTNLILAAEGFADMTKEEDIKKVQSLFDEPSSHEVHILAVFRNKRSLGEQFYKYMYTHNNNNHNHPWQQHMTEHRILSHPPKWMYWGNTTLPVWAKVFPSTTTTTTTTTQNIHIYSFEKLQQDEQDLIQVIQLQFFPELGEMEDYKRVSPVFRMEDEKKNKDGSSNNMILLYSVRYMIMEMVQRKRRSINNNDVEIQRRNVENCVSAEKVIKELAANGVLQQTCMTKQELMRWEEWTISELDNSLLSVHNRHQYDTLHLQRTLYPPYNEEQEEEDWCEIDSSAYSEDELENAMILASAPGGDCWMELIHGDGQ